MGTSRCRVVPEWQQVLVMYELSICGYGDVVVSQKVVLFVQALLDASFDISRLLRPPQAAARRVTLRPAGNDPPD
jgi:hypothetical protein